MKIGTLCSLAAVPVLIAQFAGTAQAQANPVHTHIGHVITSFNATPNAQGLLPVALAEARVAAQHAGLAARDPSNLEGMKMHAGHVLHALSPAEGSQGPGQGFGVKRATEGVVSHVGFAADAETASQNVTTHSGHVRASAGNVVQWTDEAVALAARIQAAGTAAEAAPLIEQLQNLTTRIVGGHDANGDGRVSWEAGEGGLELVEQHMGLMARGEGL
jgi:hypothetical protein